MPIFTIKSGDTLPKLRANLLQATKQPIPLTGATVQFLMKPKKAGQGVPIDAPADVIDVAAGTVEYSWADGDTAAGLYNAEFRIDLASGDVRRVPNDGYIDVVVLESLDPVVAVQGLVDTGVSPVLDIS